jgi:hypothetical protein
LAALVVLGLLTALIVSLSRRSDPAAEEPAETPPPAPQSVAIQQAWSFDPFGSGQENDDQLPLAHDGDPATAWWTEDYAVPGFVDINQQPKAGVGLVVDLGREVALRRLQVLLANDPSPLTVYVPSDAADLAAGPPLSGLDGWRAVAEIDPATEDAPAVEGDPAPDPRQRTVDLAVTTRYVLLIFHGDLPANAAGQYQVGLAEVRLWA